ncbi:hypothetical protein [Arthrobacter sp. H14]|uniref:hypothetical protein n=1 Tax=Arthrobacter sp. H14 TaxID=1312959 RepID=UPI00047E9808|nr:hypothetical protein [Arthrobacter sp. H14]
MAENSHGPHRTVKDPYGPRWLLWVFLVIAILQAVIVVATPSNTLDLVILIALASVAAGSLIMLILSHRAKRVGPEEQDSEDL